MISRDPINIKWILDYIKNEYGDSVYNTALNYKGDTSGGTKKSVEMNLNELIAYANSHNGIIPTNKMVTMVIERNNGVFTGNFIVALLTTRRSEAQTQRPYSDYNIYHGLPYFNNYTEAQPSPQASWPRSNCSIWKAVYFGCTANKHLIEYNYMNDNGISNTMPNYAPDFTNTMFAMVNYFHPGGVYWDGSHPNLTIYTTDTCWVGGGRVDGRVNEQHPLIIYEKGMNSTGTYDLTPAEEERYIAYKAPLVMMEETQPYDGINCFDLSFNGMTYVAERHQHEAGMFVRLLDEASAHSKVIFTNETICKTYDQVSYTKPILIPDEVFEKPGLIRADVYGTGTSASTVQKQFYFKVKENPSTRTALTGLTMGTNIKPFRVRNSNRIEFLWAHTGSSNPAVEIIDDDMMVKYMDIWNDSNPNVKYQISPSSNKFVIPLSYFDLKGTFHGLLRCGNNKVDSVVTEFIWNFE